MVALVLCLGRIAPFAASPATPVSLTAVDVAYQQNFDALASNGTSSDVPPGWGFEETGTNANTTYNTGTGSSTTGDTYSFGSSGNAERAFGQLRSGALITIIGAQFTNGTGTTITNVDVSYTGEQWRAGVANRNTADRMDFQVSRDATSLASGTWTDVDALDFSSPNINTAVGALDGNAAANRKAVSGNVSGLSVAPGATFWIRWTDFDISSSDDGLAIDDFTLTPHGGIVSTTLNGVGTATPASVTPGDPTVLTVKVTPATGPASTGITVNADLSAIGGNASQQLFDDGSNGDMTANDNVFTLATTVAASTSTGGTSLPFTVRDAEMRTATQTIAISITAPLTITPIHDIQGSGPVSLLTGQVTTAGIVTGVKSNGFFLQATPAEYDSNPDTSEGVFVFTTAAGLPATAIVGNRVRVTGTISEFGTAGDPVGLSITELVSPSVTLLATGQDLPPAITLTNTDLFPGASFLQLEKYESMRVHLDTVVSVTPTDGTVNEPNATSTSTGLFFAVLPGTPRPFREPGIQAPLPIPPEAPAGATPPMFDGNYEHIGVDSYSVFKTAGEAQVTTPPAGSTLEVTTGVTVTNVTGPLDYTFRLYVVDAENWNPPKATTANRTLGAVSPPDQGQFSVASFNMERFFDTTNDASTSDAVLTPAAFNGRLNKASLAIRSVLAMPDILGVEEVENLPTLQAVAAKVNSDALAAGQGNPRYQAFLVEGNDIGGIDSGFLVRADRVDLTTGAFTVTQYGKETTFIQPDGTSALLNDRPPLVLEAKVLNPPFEAYPVTVIVNHLRSLNDIEGSDATGARVRAKRRTQADYLAALIRGFQNDGRHVVSVGDYNAFDVNDGYVDVVGIVRGAPAPPNEATLTTDLPPGQLPNPALVDAIAFAPAAQRYSYVFDGNAQEIDHVLMTPEMLVNGIEYGRMDADFPESYRGDFTRPERLSDHDPIVVVFNTPDIDTNPPALTVPEDITVEGNTTGGARVTFTASAFDVIDGALTPVCAPESGTLFRVGATTVSCTATDAHGNFSTGSFVVTVKDTTAPTVTAATVTPSVLWPANKSMVTVQVNVTARDIVSSAQSRIVSVTGNDGSSAADWLITGDLSASLRADRTGRGQGRTYMLTIETRDASGNATSSTVTVFVPHDQGH